MFSVHSTVIYKVYLSLTFIICLQALASSLDKLATAIENSGEVINRGLMKIADAISNYK